jgi:hypothetical protein
MIPWVSAEKDRLLARLDLIARAEEQAAAASEQAQLAALLESDALEAAGVLTLAIEQVSRTHASVCAALAKAAEAEGDALLARALATLADSLQTVTRNAAAAAIEAHDFDEALAEERRETDTSTG